MGVIFIVLGLLISNQNAYTAKQNKKEIKALKAKCEIQERKR